MQRGVGNENKRLLLKKIKDIVNREGMKEYLYPDESKKKFKKKKKSLGSKGLRDRGIQFE